MKEDTQQQLAFIKSKCIEANGSILDLVFGCEIMIKTSFLKLDLKGVEMPEDHKTVMKVLYYAEGGSSFNGEDTEYYGPDLIVYVEDWNRKFEWGDYLGDGEFPNIEIIGRKIGIAEIMYAIQQKDIEDGYKEGFPGNPPIQSNKFYHFMSIWSAMNSKVGKDKKEFYNLLDDDITRQSPECVAFLASLLGNEAGK